MKFRNITLLKNTEDYTVGELKIISSELIKNPNVQMVVFEVNEATCFVSKEKTHTLIAEGKYPEDETEYLNKVVDLLFDGVVA